MDIIQAATEAAALLPPLLPAILDGGAKEIGKTAVAATLAKGKTLWGLLSGAPASGPMIAAAQAVATQPDDTALHDALKGQIIALLATNATLLQQVAHALNDGKAGNRVTASGVGSVAVGGNANGATITTGDTYIYPAPPAPPRALHQLPGDLLEFTGRAAELAALTTALDRDDSAIMAITIQGMGGVGKTTLAYHAAQRLTHRYPDGQIVVDLNGHGVGAPTTPIEAMQRVIRAFHPTLPPLDDVAQARAIYRDTLTGKRVLILLDNAADTDQIRDLIPPPHCGALITARALVQPPGCTVLRLDLLPLDESVALLRALAPAAAGEDADWRRLAERCGFLPLALRVAGSVLATAEVLTLPGYLAELADEATRPHRLTLDGDASANVAAVLSHSLRRLVAQDPALAARWQMLSVFPADFDCAAAAAVWDDRPLVATHPDFLARWQEINIFISKNGLKSADLFLKKANESANQYLIKMFNHSIILYDKDKERYRLHDLMRPLASALFSHAPTSDPLPGSPERLIEATGRFAVHFTKVLEEADDLYMSRKNGVIAGLALYDSEAHNILAACDWSLKNKNQQPCAKYVAAWLPYYGAYTILSRQDHKKAIKLFKNAVSASEVIQNARLIPNHLGNIGYAYAELDDPRSAIKYHTQALIASRAIGDRRSEGQDLGYIGQCHIKLGDITSAIDFCKKALHIGIDIGDRMLEGQQYGNLGEAHSVLGEHTDAIKNFVKSIKILNAIGDIHHKGKLLSSLGYQYDQLGKTEHAIRFYSRSLKIQRDIKDQRGQGHNLCRLGSAHAKLGDTPTAIALTEQALAIFVAIESPHADTARQQLARLRGDARQG